ncbi:MAG: hypothetical protein M1484_03050 [Patescibacteria group bacterium]|nr:hypothetical protein [Patescibacteria group bacterium]MCL5432050.1 hypothetical protein [Patescibacteria group bacterium]
MGKIVGKVLVDITDFERFSTTMLAIIVIIVITTTMPPGTAGSHWFFAIGTLSKTP